MVYFKGFRLPIIKNDTSRYIAEEKLSPVNNYKYYVELDRRGTWDSGIIEKS